MVTVDGKVSASLVTQLEPVAEAPVVGKKALPRGRAKTKEIEIPAIGIAEAVFHIVGDTPYIVHAWSQKAIKMIEDKQQKKASAGRETRDPEKEYQESMYRDEKGIPYIPAIQFKLAAVNACTQLDTMTKTYARGAFHINLETNRVYFTNKVAPTMRTDMIRVGMGTADVRYRAQFWPWAVDLKVRYNRRAISEEQIANLLNVAGFSVGVGEWRPEKDGQYGMFHIANK